MLLNALEWLSYISKRLQVQFTATTKRRLGKTVPCDTVAGPYFKKSHVQGGGRLGNRAAAMGRFDRQVTLTEARGPSRSTDKRPVQTATKQDPRALYVDVSSFISIWFREGNAARSTTTPTVPTHLLDRSFLSSNRIGTKRRDFLRPSEAEERGRELCGRIRILCSSSCLGLVS
jgi:hypothetical protein